MRLGYALVLILLPPSEGKATPPATPGDQMTPLDLESLSFPDLLKTRRRVLDTLIRVSSGQPGRARKALGLSKGQDSELVRNQGLRDAPTHPAGDVYAGVLYEALARHNLSAAARQRLDDSVVVMSALFGALRLTDQIPAYRLSGDAALPRLGRLNAAWRRPLASVLPPAATDVVFDLRSSTYASMWQPHDELADRTAVGRVLHRRPDGSTQVVSHFNKATKGRMVAALVRRRGMPRSLDELVTTLSALGYEATLQETEAGQPRRLDIVVDEL